jgi:hypothetical protein
MPHALALAPDLRSHEHYIDSCISLAQERLCGFASLAEIATHERTINRYPHLEILGPPRQILVLEEGPGHSDRLQRALAAVLRGEILFEHAAAGEGTRLMLGPKYFLNIAKDIGLERLAYVLSQESGTIMSAAAVAAQLDSPPERLLPLALGTRHMLQLAFDLSRLALEAGESPREILGRQHLLLIIAPEMVAHIEKEFYQWHFFGFEPSQVYFIAQESFHGLNLQDGRFFYDRQSPCRLHNHGQMVMQQAMDRQLFSLVGTHPWDKTSHSRQDVRDWLQGFINKISYNIEDLDYLTGSLDLAGLGLALDLGDQGYHMVMEVMANNPQKPQKGGMLAWDPELDRNVMIESFQLGDIDNAEIKYLNRNFNHYPQPYVSWQRVGEAGLPMPIAVKDGFLYFQPVQGDVNFLVNTAFFRRRQLAPIRNLKTPASLPLAINRMFAQDRQTGFGDFVQRCHQGAL